MIRRIDVAPGPLGPYSTCVVAGDFVFISGQIPLDPDRKEVVAATLYDQAVVALTNLLRAAEEAGSSRERLVALRVYVTDISQAPEVNRAFRDVLGEPYPAREMVGVSALPAGAMIEIAGIARL